MSAYFIGFRSNVDTIDHGSSGPSLSQSGILCSIDKMVDANQP